MNEHKRTSILKSPAVDNISANFLTIDETKAESIRLSLRDNYFAGCPEGRLSTDPGRNDLENHLFGRLDRDRKMIIPWLDGVRRLRDTSILEIGCGTGCSTVALAEQGARVTAIDVDEKSLVVASQRCLAYGLDVSFAHANATQAASMYSAEHFDCVIFYAALEHMTIPERLSAMESTWNMLSDGGLWCVIETPNRLWYYDAHTSLLPFHMWLPDELAFAYSRFSPRSNYRELYRERTDEANLHFLRRGRGVSFHEFEIAMKPVRELRIKSSLDIAKKERGMSSRLTWRFSNDYKYISLLRRIAPELHEGFLQSFLYLIIEKN